jgi:hypothetical protein
MLVQEYAAQLALEASRARENSLALWRSLEAAKGGMSAECEDWPSVDDGEVRPLRLAGRYRVGDGNEFPCEVPEISPLGIRIRGPKYGTPGKWCTACINSVGLVEGVVVQARESSFVVGVIAPTLRLRRLAQRLRWQTLRLKAKVHERRASERIYMNNAKATIETTDGQIYPCEVYDVSDGGAAVQLGSNALYFWKDQPVRFNERFGRVLRHFPGGVVIKFEEAQDN